MFNVLPAPISSDNAVMWFSLILNVTFDNVKTPIVLIVLDLLTFSCVTTQGGATVSLCYFADVADKGLTG